MYGGIARRPAPMYQTILIPTDGSPCATRAVTRGLDLADRLESNVHALYVVDTARGAESGWDFYIERQEEEGESALEAVAERAVEFGQSITPHLRRGTPSEVILDFAEEYDVSLVVMGTCGRSGLKRLLRPGSTTERVIKECVSPVVVVPPETEDIE